MNSSTPDAKAETPATPASEHIRLGTPVYHAARDAMDELHLAMRDRGITTTMMYDFGTRPVIEAILKCASLEPVPASARIEALTAEVERLREVANIAREMFDTSDRGYHVARVADDQMERLAAALDALAVTPSPKAPTAEGAE